MKKRVYILEYDFFIKSKYSDDQPEQRIRYFTFEERQYFIAEYNRIKNNDLYTDNIKTYCIDYDKFEITDEMEEIINSI
jgi:hypothetical protein